MRSVSLIAVFCVSMTFTRVADSAPLENSSKAEVSRSVYQIYPVADGVIIGVTALGNLIPNLLSSTLITPRCPCDIGEVNGIDRGAIGNHNMSLNTLSDVTLGVVMVAPLALDAADLGFRREFLEDAVVYFETLSVSGAFVTLAKYTVQRPLPLVYAGLDPDLTASPSGYRSFYSGHVSITFSALSAASMTLNYRYHLGIWPWLVTGVIGGSVAYERVAAGRHFPTDVMMGFVAGTLIGVAVPWLHHRRDELHLSLLPAPSGGLGVVWNYRF